MLGINVIKTLFLRHDKSKQDYILVIFSNFVI